MSYRSLDTAAIVRTIGALESRILERFPDSALGRIAGELLVVGRDAGERARLIAKPQILLRVAVWALVVVLGGALVVGLASSRIPDQTFELSQLLGMTEAGINVLVLVGGAIFFLVTVERRIRRSRALRAIHELRALAHVVDMHQLTKDPQRLMGAPATPTASSPKFSLTPHELSRYLDYCSEMFSLVGKLAAVYSQEFDDEAVVGAAGDVENLTTGLSRKVWQKIMILQMGLGTAPAR